MRKIDPQKVTVPDSINYSEISDELRKISQDSNYKADGKIYRGECDVDGEKIKKVAIALLEKYNGKCGYCESAEKDPKVEHHRPVGKVSKGRTNNNGYYWLAYEWTNLIASCTDCNNPPNKGIKFPISLSRSFAPPRNLDGSLKLSAFRYDHEEMMAEGAELLHPEFMDDPISHFECNQDGEFIGISDKGRASVQDYGLSRETLNVNRRAVYEPFRNRINRLIERRLTANAPITEDHFVEELKEVFCDLFVRFQNDEEKTFTFYTRYMIKNFEDFFIKPFDPLVHNILKSAYLVVFDEILNNGPLIP